MAHDFSADGGNYNYVKIYDDSSSSTSPVTENLDFVRKIVYERENPHPVTVLVMMLVCIMVIYIIYILFIKRNISGVWFGGSDQGASTIKYKLIHNPFTDNIRITKSENGGETTIDGKLVGHTIWLFDGPNKVAGVLFGKNKIIWLNSDDVWDNVKVLN